MKVDDFIPLSDPQRGRLVQLLNFQRYKALEDETGIFNDWEGYSYRDFASFQSRCLSGSDPPAPVQRTPRKTGATKVALSKAELFRRGIKRDPAAFPVLKSEKIFTTWIRGMKAEMAAQGVSNICKVSYIEPTDQEELK